MSQSWHAVEAPSAQNRERQRQQRLFPFSADHRVDEGEIAQEEVVRSRWEMAPQTEMGIGAALLDFLSKLKDGKDGSLGRNRYSNERVVVRSHAVYDLVIRDLTQDGIADVNMESMGPKIRRKVAEAQVLKAQILLPHNVDEGGRPRRSDQIVRGGVGTDEKDLPVRQETSSVVSHEMNVLRGLRKGNRLYERIPIR